MTRLEQIGRWNTPSPRLSQEPRYGLYKAVVEDVSDPENLGRIRARIVGIHSFQTSEELSKVGEKPTLTNDLPPALPCFQSGQFIVPSVGDTVWVMFENGDPDYPVYFGTWYGILKSPRAKGRLPAAGPVPQRSTKTDPSSTPANISAKNTKTYVIPAGNDAPEESWAYRQFVDPSVYVFGKTPKGHTIYAVDEDGAEKLVIVDRFGQKIEFACPVGKSYEHNNARRGVKEVGTNNGSLSLDNASGGATSLKLMDASGQYVSLLANESGATVTLAGAGGTVKIEKDGNRITLASGANSVTILDDNMSLKTDGTLTIETGSSISIKGSSVTIEASTIDLKGLVAVN
jgi:hypothetical protein